MRDEGWTIGDLAGELWERGIDIDDVSDAEIYRQLDEHRPESAARNIEREERGLDYP